MSLKAAMLSLSALLAATTAPIAAPLTADEAARIDASSAPMPGEPSLAEVRALTAKYRDVAAALADGYVRDPANNCETAEMMGRPRALGTMGIHYFRPDLLGITAPPDPRVTGTGTHTDFRTPAVLIYEPQADGTLELVAVENLVFAGAWKGKSDSPPKFHGVAWDRMADDPATPIDEAHLFEPHYDRHVWLYRENPSGVFAQYNPRASCADHRADHRGGAHVHVPAK